MTEKIISDEKFREGIKAGIDKLANVVKDTLGPSGNTVVIKNAFGEIIITKDGVSVAEEIFLPTDTIENIGSELVKNVALKANNLAGDGTTSATVLAQAIYNAGLKFLALGTKPGDFNKGIKIAVIDILSKMTESVVKVDVEGDVINSVALVSSNGDEAVAAIITEIYKELGENAVISVTQGNGFETEYNIVKGMQFDRGFSSPYCVTDKIKMKADFNNPFIFLYDGKINDFETVAPALEHAGQNARPLIVVAENVEDGALRGLALNHLKGNVQSAIIMSPGYGQKRTSRLEDMGVLFGAEVISKDNIEEFDPIWLGEADRAEITKSDTAFIGGKGFENEIEERINFLKECIKEQKGNKYETDILKERLGKLSGGVAVIKVGAVSREEGKELLDRVEDCKHAVRAALEEGIVDGGGIALYNASNHLMKRPFKEDIPTGVKEGYLALLQAVKAPFKQILINAGENVEVIESYLPAGGGYDARNKQYTHSMINSGIIDPFKVVRIALESSSSIVGTLLTSNYAVINKDDTTTTTFS